MPANFPKTLAEMQGYKSELLATPRYQLVFEAVKPLFANFSTKKLARLIGGIVALTKESDLTADASFAVNATWATNMTKASIASNVATGVGAIAPALGAALTTSAILIMKVVVVAIAVYAAYRALKLMWKLAVWVANKIGEMVRKKKPDDDQCSKYTSLAEQVVCVFEPHLGQLGQPSGQQGLQIAQRMIQVNGNTQVLELITKRKKDLVVQIKGLAGSNTALPTKATEFLKDLGTPQLTNVKEKLLVYSFHLSNSDLLKLFRVWQKFDDLERRLANVTSGELRKNTEILKKTLDWDEQLFSKLGHVTSRNVNFFKHANPNVADIQKTPEILDYFEEGAGIIKNKRANLKAVELDMYAGDRMRKEEKVIFEPNTTNYLVNQTQGRYHLDTLKIDPQSGKIRYKDNNQLVTTDNVKGEGLMYVIDENDNIRIGGRGGEISYPHPTLVGGTNPNVKCAGMIRFKNGRIFEVNINSGHFKPSHGALKEAERVFRLRFSKKSFDSKFRGFIDGLD